MGKSWDPLPLPAMDIGGKNPDEDKDRSSERGNPNCTSLANQALVALTNDNAYQSPGKATLRPDHDNKSEGEIAPKSPHGSTYYDGIHHFRTILANRGPS